MLNESKIGRMAQAPRLPWRIACLGLLLVGCTSQVRVPAAKMVTGTVLGKSHVYAKDGSFYVFDSVRFLPDSLLGEYKAVVEHQTQAEGTYYEKEVRTFGLSLGGIDSVTVIRRDPGKTLLCGAGALAIGALFVNLTEPGPKPKSGPSDQSKPAPGN